MIKLFNIEEIKDPSFLKDLNYKEKKQLAKEIREFLITKISKTGGHLSSNLGIVELEIALKSVFSYEDTLFLYVFLISKIRAFIYSSIKFKFT